MNKKTTTADVAKIFPGAHAEMKDGVITLPLHPQLPGLRLVMPQELPLGTNAAPLLPGDFHQTNLPTLCGALGAQSMVWLATGRFEPSDGEAEAKFYFDEPLSARQLLIAAEWETNPPYQTKGGLDSLFGKDYQACFFQRFMPMEAQGLNKILLNLPGATPLVLGPLSGMDFWVIERTDFCCQLCEILSQNLRQAIMMGNRENDSDTTSAVCRQLFKGLAQEIEQDARLTGWRLVCEDASAELTMVDGQGKEQTLTLLYKPTFLAGLQDYIARAQEGTLVLPTGN